MAAARWDDSTVRTLRSGSRRFVPPDLDVAVPTGSGGKSSGDSDIVEARYVDIVHNDRVVQAVDFVSEDPAFAGTMTMTWTVRAVDRGTRVDITADDVPDGISPDDHAAGLGLIAREPRELSVTPLRSSSRVHLGLSVGSGVGALFRPITGWIRPGMAEILQLDLHRRPKSVGLARDAARVVLIEVCDDQQLDDVLTVISELVTNAVKHTGGGCSLTLLHDGDLVVVEVRDTDTRSLQRKHDSDTLGHGLGVVQSLASRWGIDRMSSGKCVWAELAVARSGAR